MITPKYMGYIKNIVNIALLFLLSGAAVAYLNFWSPATTFNSFFLNQNQPCPHLDSLHGGTKDELEVALDNASMSNKTVIIAMVNKAYVEEQDGDVHVTMLNLFLESFWVGEETRQLLDHLLVVAMDQTAYNRCKFRRLHCYRLVTDGVDLSGEKIFMSKDFNKMMWRRTKFLLDVLKLGYNFIFTDTDVMWLRNPFARLSKNETEDMQISTDDFNGDPWSQTNLINTGFYYVRSNNRTISLFQKWYDLKDSYRRIKEQDVLMILIRNGVLTQLGMNVRFLDTLYFNCFCTGTDSRDVAAVTTLHANCCISMSAKKADLVAVLRDWKKFRRLNMGGEVADGGNGTLNFKWSEPWACTKAFHLPNNP